MKGRNFRPTGSLGPCFFLRKKIWGSTYKYPYETDNNHDVDLAVHHSGS